VTKRSAWVLLAAAGWTFFVWITFIRNIVGEDDRSTGFKVVHVVLAVISIAFGAAIAMIALRGLKASGDRSERTRA
jgi:hypothetical protein